VVCVILHQIIHQPCELDVWLLTLSSYVFGLERNVLVQSPGYCEAVVGVQSLLVALVHAFSFVSGSVVTRRGATNRVTINIFRDLKCHARVIEPRGTISD
jgi:hypothetical protein